MSESATQLTEEYIESHPSVRDCLKRGIINYSALARDIAKELSISKKSSLDAIIVAARRYKEKTAKSSADLEKKIAHVISNSEFQIQNKIAVAVIDKEVLTDYLTGIQLQVKKKHELFYAIEGSTTTTVILQEKNFPLIQDKLSTKIHKVRKNMSLIMLKSSEEIENTPGVIAYLSGLFFQNGVNIYEIMSCWKDTLIVINTSEISAASKFLNF